METEAETDKGAITIRLSGRVERRSIYGKRRGSVYDAKCGPIEVTAPTRTEATAALAEAVAHSLDTWGSPVALWSLDGRECWIAFPQPGGDWGYRTLRSDDRYNGREGSTIYPTRGGMSREECLKRMREHWYDLNVGDIVLGILGLCTDLRRWDCPKCRTVQASHMPYKCKNPACGVDAPAFNW